MKNIFVGAIEAPSLAIPVLHLGVMATALSLGVVIWQLSFHIAFAGERNSIIGHLVHAVGDTALLLPLALFVIVMGLKFSDRIGLNSDSWHGVVGSASIISILFVLGAVPGVSIHGNSHVFVDRIIEGSSQSSSVDSDDRMGEDMKATEMSLSEAGLHGFHDGAISQIIVLPMSILGVLLLSKSGNLANGARRRKRRE